MQHIEYYTKNDYINYRMRLKPYFKENIAIVSNDAMDTKSKKRNIWFFNRVFR